jgi:hypothetical protein
MGDRRERNCPFARPSGGRPRYFDETHRDEDFNFVRGGDFSGDGGGCGDFTEIKSWREYFMTSRDISWDLTGNVVVKSE